MVRLKTNGAQFKFKLSQFAERAKGNMTYFANGFCDELSKRVIAETPIATPHASDALRAFIGLHIQIGELRAAWKMTPQPGSIKLGQRFVMVNSAPYAMRVEFGFSRHPDALGRHYHQKGRGFVRRVVRQRGLIANQVASEINS